jgi:hypothetical protein
VAEHVEFKPQRKDAGPEETQPEAAADAKGEQAQEELEAVSF